MALHISTELTQAARRLVAARTFTIVAVLTLALGAGALGTIYAVAKSLFLDPLPFPEADRIVVVTGEMRRDDVQSWPVGVLDLVDVAARQQALAGPVPVAGGRALSVLFGDVVEHVTAELVGADYFSVFGVVPAAGRFFTAEESLMPQATAAVLSEALWREQFGEDRDVVGRTLIINELSVTIVGIAPRGFRGLSDGAQMWLPIGSAAALYQPGYLDVREFRWLAGVARLADDAELETAASQVEAALRTLETEFPNEYEGFHLDLEPLPSFLFGDLRQPVWIMLAAAILVLGIACTNLASLLLVRGMARRRETALRRALGADTRTILAGVTAELVLLSVAGGTIGLLAAQFVIDPLVGNAGVGLPSFVTPSVDPGVVILTMALCFVTSLCFGLGPAWYAGRVDPADALKESGAAVAGGRGRARLLNTLVAVETALAIMLLVGTGLLLRGLSTHLRTDLGFTAEGVTLMRVNMAGERYQENDRYSTTASELVAHAAALPGVTHAALEGPGYPTFGTFGLHFWNDNAPGGPEDYMMSRHHVTPGYFDAMGMQLIAGRDFTAADQGDARNVVIVNRDAADRLWPGQDPLGRSLRTSRGTELVLTVIGVAENVRHQGYSMETFTAPDVYLPLLGFPPRAPASMTLLARSDLDAETLAAQLRAAIRSVDPGIPPVEIRALSDAVREQTARNRLLTTLMGGFAALALLLAAVGVYGVVAYSVEQGARELSIRIAIGAGTGTMLRHVLARGLTPVGAGLLLGLAGVPVVQRLVASQLFGVEPFDSAALAGSLGLLAATALSATLIPAARAARLDPLTVLKGG